MSEALTDTVLEEREEELTFPATLPVLPLKDTVVFPESVTPLAIGQERSIKLVEDVVSGERVLALVTVKNPDADQPGWDDLYDVGTAAVDPQDDQGPRRNAADPRAGAATHQAGTADAGRPVSRR